VNTRNVCWSDVHKKVCRAAVVNDEREVVDEFGFRNSKKGIDDFMMVLFQ